MSKTEQYISQELENRSDVIDFVSDLSNISNNNKGVFTSCKPSMYYVYALFDEVNNRVFYIGKGMNERMYDHRKCDGTNKYKDNYIKTIKGKYIELVLIDGLHEEDAYCVESIIINKNYNQLTNIVNPLNIWTERSHDFTIKGEFENYAKENGWTNIETFKTEEIPTKEISEDELIKIIIACKEGLKINSGLYLTKEYGIQCIGNVKHLYPEIWQN